MANWYQSVWWHMQTLSPPPHPFPSSAHSECPKQSSIATHPGFCCIHCLSKWDLHALCHSGQGPRAFPALMFPLLHLASLKVLLLSPSAEISPLPPIPNTTLRSSCHTRAVPLPPVLPSFYLLPPSGRSPDITSIVRVSATVAESETEEVGPSNLGLMAR